MDVLVVSNGKCVVKDKVASQGIMKRNQGSNSNEGCGYKVAGGFRHAPTPVNLNAADGRVCSRPPPTKAFRGFDQVEHENGGLEAGWTGPGRVVVYGRPSPPPCTRGVCVCTHAKCRGGKVPLVVLHTMGRRGGSQGPSSKRQSSLCTATTRVGAPQSVGYYQWRRFA